MDGIQELMKDRNQPALVREPINAPAGAAQIKVATEILEVGVRLA